MATRRCTEHEDCLADVDLGKACLFQRERAQDTAFGQAVDAAKDYILVPRGTTTKQVAWNHMDAHIRRVAQMLGIHYAEAKERIFQAAQHAAGIT